MTNPSIENVSDTALWVANFRAAETQRPDALFKDPLAAVLLGDRGREIARSMPYPDILAWIMAVRTVAIDKLIFEAITQGANTVVNLGAGLDTRPYRLDLPKALRWIEIDFPHIIALKNDKLASETPKCSLERIGLDLSDRAAATRCYAEIGAQTSKALIITEGVIIYLSNEQAGQLADDLRKVPGFQYWIQDYRRSGKGWIQPGKLKRKLKNAPFRFDHPDPLAFFETHGWGVMNNILAIDEGERIGRKFPVPFPWNLLVPLAPKARLEQFRKAAGYALLRAIS